MEKKASLSAMKREVVSSRENRRLRREGLIPANIYGEGRESEAISLKREVLRKAILEHGLTAVYSLTVEKAKPVNVMVRSIQPDPVTREPIHVDLQQISLTKELKVEVPIRFLNKEILEMKKLLLSTQMDLIVVRGLPNDIPTAFEIDAETIIEKGRLFVSDLEMPEGIETDVDPEALIASIGEAKADESAEAAPEAEGEAAEETAGEAE